MRIHVCHQNTHIRENKMYLLKVYEVGRESGGCGDRGGIGGEEMRDGDLIKKYHRHI